MAKKPKTPRPPVQAPKRRETKSPTAGGVPRWALVVAALVAAGVIAGVVLAMSGGDDDGSSGLQSAMQAAGCTVRDVPPLPPVDGAQYHSDSPTETTKVKWSTSPPSAGGHYGAWAVWRFYRAPISPNKIVHNLEHGGVAIWWGPKVPAATIDKLEAFYRESPDGMVGTPYAGLGDKIALTAWSGDPAEYYRDDYYGTGHIATCSQFDEDAFKAFRDEYRDQGPERGTDNSEGSGP